MRETYEIGFCSGWPSFVIASTKLIAEAFWNGSGREMEDGSINGLALEGVAELLTNADVLFISIDSATVTIQRDMVRSYMGYDHWSSKVHTRDIANSHIDLANEGQVTTSPGG